jgi:methionine sulfoxide reductase heme-binding subunit
MALWYLMRGTGVASLVLLTLTLVMGIVNVQRWSPRRIPRFLLQDAHRTLSLTVVVLIAVHVVTAVVDKFVSIRLLDVLVPFAAQWKPLWVGLGALSLDVMAAVIVTSLVRARLGLRAWRAVHWLAYAAWPLALLHSLGTGTDVAAGWMRWLALGCIAAVASAVTVRLMPGERELEAAR